MLLLFGFSVRLSDLHTAGVHGVTTAPQGSPASFFACADCGNDSKVKRTGMGAGALVPSADVSVFGSVRPLVLERSHHMLILYTATAVILYRIEQFSNLSKLVG
jgi:hypothetical protein